MNEEKPFCQGHALSNLELHALIKEYDAEACYGVIACGSRHVNTGKNVVLLVLGYEDNRPVAYAPIACVHGIEAIVDRLRKAAADTFADQPCTICERAE